MSTTFPTALDSPLNPVGTDALANAAPGLQHHVQHDNTNDAVSVMQAKIGIDGSAVVTSLDYLVKNSLSVDPGHKHSHSSISDWASYFNQAVRTTDTPLFTCLSLEGADNFTGYAQVFTYADSVSNYPLFYFKKSRGVKATRTAVVKDDYAGGFGFAPYDGTQYLIRAGVFATVDGVVSGTTVPTALLFTTSNDTNPAIEHMRVNSDGKVGIGKTAATYLLEVNGVVEATQLRSTIASGTAPFIVASPTLVTNLNADLLDGHHSSDFLTTPYSLTVEEVDGVPSVSGVVKIKVTNGKLTDNGSGTVSLDLSTPAPAAGGADTNVQYNDSGALAGATYLTYTKATGTVAINATASPSLTFGTGVTPPKIFLSSYPAGTTLNIESGGAAAVGQLIFRYGDIIYFSSHGGTARASLDADGCLFLGDNTAPTARLHLLTGDSAYYGILFGAGNSNLYRSASNVIKSDGALTCTFYTSRVATGTSPYACTSTTLNTNLNADLLDGYHLDQNVLTTSSPVFHALNLEPAADAGGYIQLFTHADAVGTYPIFYIDKSRGSKASPTAVVAGDYVGTVGFAPYSTNAEYEIRAAIYAYMDAAVSAGVTPTALIFGAGADGATERMRISSSGKIGIGKTAATYLLEVNGEIQGTGYRSSDGTAGMSATRIFNDGAVVNTVTIKNGLITAWTQV